MMAPADHGVLWTVRHDIRFMIYDVQSEAFVFEGHGWLARRRPLLADTEAGQVLPSGQHDRS